MSSSDGMELSIDPGTGDPLDADIISIDPNILYRPHGLSFIRCRSLIERSYQFFSKKGQVGFTDALFSSNRA